MASSQRIHRNITFRRLMFDAYQSIRCLRPVVRRLGRPFAVSNRFIEIDLTYRCNLRCRNCNRSCAQAPSRRDITIGQIEAYIKESIASGRSWDRIRLLGGEPTLHPSFSQIVEMLRHYRFFNNPNLRIVVCTNGYGPRVGRALESLPGDIEVKNTWKGSRQRLFRPFNIAPVDRSYLRWSEFSCGCRILEECGLGLTPRGYYPCAVAGSIDRVFGFGRGRDKLPGPTDTMQGDLNLFCRLCGHFGFAWPTHRTRISPTWERAYQRYHGRWGGMG